MAHWKTLLFQPSVFSRALDCGERSGAACTHGASLGPDRAPWRVLVAFKVARAGSLSRDQFPPSQSQAGRWKPTHKQKKTQWPVFACSAVYNTSPGRLATSHLERGRVATWLARTSALLACNSSHASSSFLRDTVVFVRVCVQGWQIEISKKKAVQLILLREYCCGSMY